MDLTELIPAWLEATKDVEVSTGLPVDEALRKAALLREAIRQGTIRPEDVELSSDFAEVLHALSLLLERDENATPECLLTDGEALFHFTEALAWPNDEPESRLEALARMAFLCWRNARRNRNASKESKWRRVHEQTRVADNKDVLLSVRDSAGPPSSRFASSSIDSEQLLALSALLWKLGEAEPARAKNEAEFVYRFLATPERSIGALDERDYYLGEFALIAGGTCRILSRRDEARKWFDFAEASFVLAHNSSAHLARLGYQRLALRLEERDLDSVVQLAPHWFECFLRLDLKEEALKCRFLEAHALKEMDRLEDAKSVFRQIRGEADSRGLTRLSALASENLFQLHAFLGEVEDAMSEAKAAAAILRAIDNRVALAKLQGGLGYLHRSQGRSQESVLAFRHAQKLYAELKMYADVAAAHLVLADLLLDTNQPAQAEWEIRAALPVIDELKLVPEGIAALSLLRESVRRRQIDRQALRSLNGYFEELGS
jgi:hypothetical protein